MIKYENLSFQWLGHDGFVVTAASGKKVCIDPFKVEKHIEPVDIIISTHEHRDHCNPEDIKKFIGPKTQIIAIHLAEQALHDIGAQVHYVKPGDLIEMQGIKVQAVPAYNTNKFREPGKPFHPKEDNKIGVVVEMDGTRFYHAGDTDHIPEMKDIETDVALVPVSGTYVMTAEEALEAVKDINPKLAIPMHYGSIVGDDSMAKMFKEKASCPVELPQI